jgi:hypothetical protein
MDRQEERMEPRHEASKATLHTGPGSGHLCDECSEVIETRHVECRSSGGSRNSRADSRFHQWCYYARFGKKT